VQHALAWHQRRTFHHSAFTADRLAAVKRGTVSVLLPARNEVATIGPILEALLPLRDRGLVDQVVVLDDSVDGTGDVAAALGAEVYAQSALRPELGPVAGKGDAMWRGLTVATGDVVCFLDADSRDLGAHFALGLVGPVLTEPGVQFVKAFYRRPLDLGATQLPEGGGRVTELTARPLLNRFFPELAGFHQPLAGEIAARRELLERLPFACGYAVDVGLLIDAWREVGLDALAQVDLDSRQNRHQPLADLGPMAGAVLSAVARRLEDDGRLTPTDDPAVPYLERPPVVRLGRLGARV
jgi:glucosyl-3-phosphoglycerate synthase